jgi:hypothetical protein
VLKPVMLMENHKGMTEFHDYAVHSK